MSQNIQDLLSLVIVIFSSFVQGFEMPALSSFWYLFISVYENQFLMSGGENHRKRLCGVMAARWILIHSESSNIPTISVRSWARPIFFGAVNDLIFTNSKPGPGLTVPAFHG